VSSGPGSLPRFDDLPVLEGLGLRHAWGHADGGDELGSVGRLGPADVLGAVSTIRDGTVWDLTVPLGTIDPPLYGREALRHTVFRVDRNTWDDRLDNFFLQSSTHWDGLRHIQARELGHWGGRTDESAIVAGGGPLGIDGWVRHGFVGRGVLLDVADRLERDEPSYDPLAKRSVSAQMLDEIARDQGVEIGEREILCVRLGWTAAYERLGPPLRGDAKLSTEFAGLAADEDMARWLWDRRVTAVAADNPGVEVSPGDRTVGSLHRRMIPMLGIALGELFDFDALARACREDGRWQFLIASVPLNLPGGVGSPANAVAIR
jgi:kynurenine formamidase